MGTRMPAKAFDAMNKLYFNKPKRVIWDGLGKDLPPAYKRFWVERYHQQPSAVHYIPEEGKYKRNPETGVVTPVQNIPIPLIYPKASHKGLWGGCAFIKGYRQSDPFQRRNPTYWKPVLKYSVVYSEVLDKYMKVVVTDRTIQLIHENFGLDHYLLKTPASDLQSDLALKIKRQILIALDRNELPHEDAEKRQEVYDTYKQYLEKYDSEFIEWYGLTLKEAIIKKKHKDGKMNMKPVPLKVRYRQELLGKLAEPEMVEPNEESSGSSALSQSTSLVSKLKKWNPLKSQ